MPAAPATEFLNPLIAIGKPETPLLFLDTLFWRRLLQDPDGQDTQHLRTACARGSVHVVITDLVKAELTRRHLLPTAQDLCGPALLSLPMDRIALNQALRSLVGYLERQQGVPLRWQLMISEPPVDTRAEGLGTWVARYVADLNAYRQHNPSATKEGWTFAMVEIEEEVWRNALAIYRDRLLAPRPGADVRTFDRYFSTDYFRDLPVVTLKVYYLGDILGQRPVKRQDVIDVYSIGELLPYTNLYLMDKDQHARLSSLMQRYPPVFSYLGNLTAVRSHWKRSEDPWAAFRAFLTHCAEKAG